MLPSDLQTIEQYIKNVNNINSNNMLTSHLLQSKHYLKIIDISYLIENTNTSINSSVIETILKNTYFFNNISLASKLRIIKVSLKSDIAIIWVDIWDSQSDTSAKTLINHCFNVESHIITVHDTNANSEVPQCKNC